MVRDELKRKFSNAHFENTFFRMQEVKELQTNVEHGNGIGQASFNEGFDAMMNLFGFTHHRQQRKGRFNDHAAIPSSFFADFDIVRHTLSATKAPISQENGLLVIFFKEIQKGLIRAIQLVPNPATDLTEAVENPAQFDSNAPATFILALSTKLLLGTSSSDWENQFHRIAIHNIQHTRLLQQQISRMLVFAQLSHQVRAIWQATKQLIVVSLKPAIKGPEMTAFECKQDTDGYYLTWIQLGNWVFGNLTHAIIDVVENVNNNIFSSHDLCLSFSFDN